MTQKHLFAVTILIDFNYLSALWANS